MKWIIGIDEVGRGPIAGPVTVCATAMPYGAYKKARWVGLTDSKQMTKLARQKWYAKAKDMEKKGSIRIAIASQTAAQIDKKGISSCIKTCIRKNLQTLGLDPKTTLVLLDGGLRAPLEYTHQKTIVKGDSKHKIISLASVVAKVTRDVYMHTQSQTYPGYGWERNVGYGTQEHYRAIRQFGLTKLHRKSFIQTAAQAHR